MGSEMFFLNSDLNRLSNILKFLFQVWSNVQDFLVKQVLKLQLIKPRIKSATGYRSQCQFIPTPWFMWSSNIRPTLMIPYKFKWGRKIIWHEYSVKFLNFLLELWKSKNTSSFRIIPFLWPVFMLVPSTSIRKISESCSSLLAWKVWIIIWTAVSASSPLQTSGNTKFPFEPSTNTYKFFLLYMHG